MAQRTFGRVGVWILFAGILALAAVPAGGKNRRAAYAVGRRQGVRTDY